MFFVIFKGVKYYSEIDNWTNSTINSCGSFDNQQEFIDNTFEHEKAPFDPLTGKSKVIPEGPSCMFKNKLVPCFTR